MVLKNIGRLAFATLVFTTTANGYFDSDSLKKWSDQELVKKAYRLSLKRQEISKNESKKEGQDEYISFKLALLSAEQKNRGLQYVSYGRPEDRLVSGVYQYLSSKIKPKEDFLNAFKMVFPGDDALSLLALKQFAKGCGIVPKQASTANLKEENSSGTNKTIWGDDREDPRTIYLNAFMKEKGFKKDPAFLSDSELLEKLKQEFNEENSQKFSTSESKSEVTSTQSEVQGTHSEQPNLKEENSSGTNEIRWGDDREDPRTIYLNAFMKEKGFKKDPAFLSDSDLLEKLEQEFDKETLQKLRALDHHLLGTEHGKERLKVVENSSTFKKRRPPTFRGKRALEDSKASEAEKSKIIEGEKQLQENVPPTSEHTSDSSKKQEADDGQKQKRKSTMGYGNIPVGDLRSQLKKVSTVVQKSGKQ